MVGKKENHMNTGWGFNFSSENLCRHFPPIFASKCILQSVSIKREWSPANLFPFNLWLAEKAASDRVGNLQVAIWRAESRICIWAVSTLTTLGSHEMICMHACSFAWWFKSVSVSLCKPVSLCLCVCVCLRLSRLTRAHGVCVRWEFGAVGQVFHTARGGVEGTSLPPSSSAGLD